MKPPTVHDIKKELVILTARSSGPGGQHVNKVETKVTLKWSVTASHVLTDAKKKIISEQLRSRITSKGELIISVDSQRSQLKNKEQAYKKLNQLLKKCFVTKKPRVATQPTKASKQKRLHTKKVHSEKKALRKRID